MVGVPLSGAKYVLIGGTDVGAVIVSTPQDVALIDARKGVNMFRKINIPVRRSTFFPSTRNAEPGNLPLLQIIGTVLNQSHFTCSCCNTRHELFGSPASFNRIAEDMSLDVLGTPPFFPPVLI